MMESDFRIGDWLVSPLTNTVVGPDGETRVEPKAMQVLALLAGRAGDVVSKQELLSSVWEGTFVSDEVLANAIWELRRTLGDDAKRPRFIQTLPKKGYRLIASVSPPEGTAEEVLGVHPRRTLFRWVAAIAGVGIVAGASFWLMRGSAGGTDASRKWGSVAVMEFENLTSSAEQEWLATGVPTMLRTGLAEVSGLQVVSDARFDRGELEGGARARREIARRAGADAIVVGSIFRQGSDYRIDAQIEDATDGNIVAAHSVRGSDVFALLDELTGRVRDSLNVGPARAPAPVPPLREMTTASLEAFRLYNEAVEARRHLRLGDARRFLTEAVRIDPNFALAYLELQWVAAWSKDEPAFTLYRQKTLEYEERLPPHKRTLLRAGEAWKEDPARAIAMLEALIAESPGEEEAYLQLSHQLRGRYQMAESLEVLERGVAAIPHSGYLRLYYGYGLLWEGRYPEAFSQFETYSRINPGEANPWDSLGEAYLIAGIPERALEKYERALEIDPRFTWSYLGRAWALGMLGRYDEALASLESIDEELPEGYSLTEVTLFRAYVLSRAGRYREAEALLARLEEANERQPKARFAQTLTAFRALLSLERGDAAGALARIESERVAEGGSRQLGALATLLGGIAACRSGDLEKGRAYLVELGKMHEQKDPRETWWYHLLLGEVALGSGDAKAAYSAFKQGEPRKKLLFSVNQVLPSLGGSLIFRDGTARARHAEGDVSAAREAYRDLLRPDIGQKWTALQEPRFTLALARLEREAGNRAAASRHYREFLELWSRADSALPEIAEARAYLGSS
jgi:DNA-binding winged helix-turn-helix (wHTH) protein/tetratricopeptide (TPR) repeat protein/TolB-like protein